MDRARRIGGLLWVMGGLAFQLIVYAVDRVVPGPVTLLLIGVMTALAVTTLARNGRAMWLVGWLAAGLLGLDFAGAVADRFGLFGPPGAPGVSWGSWPAFVDYTVRLLPGLSPAVVAGAAVLATVVEMGLTAALLSGWQRRWVGKAAAGLLMVYLVSMGLALGVDAVAAYGLPVLIGGALLISVCPARRPVRAPGLDVPDRQPIRDEVRS